MNLKRTPFAIQDKNLKDLDYAKNYPTLSDLMKEQNVSSNKNNTVHRRRDLDSLGEFIKIKI
tara:strand:- start:75 stop:260 length:186 start_codon:yes stop_codon:yes gene_type:complete